jgi:LysM repeat protein
MELKCSHFKMKVSDLKSINNLTSNNPKVGEILKVKSKPSKPVNTNSNNSNDKSPKLAPKPATPPSLPKVRTFIFLSIQTKKTQLTFILTIDKHPTVGDYNDF